MKFYFLFALILSLSSSLLLAQPGRSISVKAGEDMAQAYSPYGFYRFPQFGKASLYFKDGSRSTSKQLNYNMLSGKLQFIGPQADTLDLVGQADIDSVVFADNVLLYNNGLMEIVAVANPVKLLKRITIKTNTESVGTYGQSGSTSSVASLARYLSGAAVYNMVLNQDVVITENISWFFANENNNPVKANKANLLKLLPAEKQTKAELYLKQNKINFEKENDLEKLLETIRS